MEILILLLILVLIIINIDSKRSQLDVLRSLKARIDLLLDETSRLKEEVGELSKRPASPPKPSFTPAQNESKPQPTFEKRSDIPALVPVSQKPVLKEIQPPIYQPMHEIKESWQEKWLKNNPDLEKFIGENLINKIGIAILVLGISFFVKYAIDKNWINETGRVSIGLFCGVLLIGLAHYLRNSYRSFSSVLAGGGIAVFYFTIAFAFHEYRLITQTNAFIIMVVITSFSILLSVLYNKTELAVIAAIGGFLTPFLVSTGQGNYIVLFTYIIILNTGLLALAFFKRWPLINILSFFFTLIIYGGWLVKVEMMTDPKISYLYAFGFLLVLYLLFLGMNMIYQVKRKQDFLAIDYSLILLLNGSFFAAGMVLLSHINNGQFQGIFTIGAGFINLCLAWYFFKTQLIQKSFVHLLIGITISFLSLAIPVQLNGHAITLFWSVEFVLLFWLFQRIRITLFFYSSLLVAVFTLISLLMDWSMADMQTTSDLVLIFTDSRGLVTNIVAMSAFACFAILMRKETGKRLPLNLEQKPFVITSTTIAVVIAYLTGIYGVNLIFSNMSGYEIPNVYHRIITEIAVGLVIIWKVRNKNIYLDRSLAGCLALYFVYHLFSFSLVQNLRNGVLEGRYEFFHLAMHWISLVFALSLLYMVVQVYRKAVKVNLNIGQAGWIFSFLLLFFFSHEMKHIFVFVAGNESGIDYLEGQYSKAILTIVWALCSFGLMWLGMKHKIKTFRIISLTVFSIALLKLFFYDIANVSEGGKIAAFILLGILLLTISFMYQKLKKIIIDNEKN